MTTNCANCDNPLSESFSFCPVCGQKTNLHRLNLYDVWHDAFHYFTHADKGILQLLKALVTKTGTIAREYVGGKRKKYFPPLNFYLIIAAIYVFITGAMPAKLKPANNSNEAVLSRIKDPVRKEEVRHIFERSEKASVFMSKHSNVIAILALPLIALVFRIFYARGKYNYTEHLVATMYMAGFTNLCYVLVFTPVFTLLNISSLNSLPYFVIFQVAYDANFYYHFINRQTTGGAIKAIGASITAIILWTALSYGLITFYITNGFWGLMH
jgi:hypothetical protein